MSWGISLARKGAGNSIDSTFSITGDVFSKAMVCEKPLNGMTRPSEMTCSWGVFVLPMALLADNVASNIRRKTILIANIPMNYKFLNYIKKKRPEIEGIPGRIVQLKQFIFLSFNLTQGHSRCY
jgi:hypothetical protein